MASHAKSGAPGAAAAGSGSAPGDVAEVPCDNVPLVYIGVMLAALLQVLDTTIANVALPHMQAALGATTETVTWVLTSYIVASAIALPITGWLAGRMGMRELFILSTAAFVIFSALCGLATNLTQMVAFRVGQGVAGAFLMPLSQAVLLDVTRPSRHPQAMALWGMGVIIGPIAGPILGGWLTENFEWRWVFFVNVPLGAISLFLMITQLPRWTKAKVRLDFLGFALLALFLGSLQLLLDRGEHIDWFDSAEAWVYAALAASCGWGAVVHLAMSRNPLFDRALFKDRNFVIALLVMVVVGIAVFATLALLPPMLQNLLGFDVLDTGFVLAPRGVGVLISMQLAGFLIRRGADPRIVIAAGFGLTAYSMFEMSAWSLEVDSFHIIWTGVVQGLGLGLIFIPLNVAAFATLAPRLRTEASAILNLTRSVGASVGISVVVSILARSIQINHAELGANITATTLPMIDIDQARIAGPVGEAAFRMIDMEINRQAAMIGYLNDFYLMGWACLLSLPLAFLVRIKRPGG
ncbi:EmrB/QacA family drug resistance transporter [Novosphingobium marinum]|uniref:DHA2 family multidrug resistance protein n=1 Tax=Novosphingobium marinum TaxID=1514948 RepID=A0A7Z0BS72_9SPHN|nr:MDR family MFS transporter [Novosphingobium marinum]NYH93859.1 DHA2 family multidrug resistance protein [Novosphingobium marinum]GGC17831.1 EmrB/QacA family drug resistance transporter [Novosphingobium marinum]